MADDQALSASQSDLASAKADFERRIAALEASIPALIAAGVQSAMAKMSLNGDSIISFSGQFPSWTARITMPPLNLQGSGSCVDGDVILNITGGF